MFTLKELRAMLLAAQKEVNAVTDAVQKEKRSMTDEEVTTFDTAMQKVDSLKRQVAAKEMTPDRETASTSKDQVNEEFRGYLRGEARASTGNSNNTDASGKFVNPDAFSGDLFAEITSDGGVLSICKPMPVSSDTLNYPTIDDTLLGATGDISQDPELETITRREMVIGNVVIPLNQYAVETVISNQLRDDNAVNLEQTIASLGAAGIRRSASLDVFTAIDSAVTYKTAAAEYATYDELLELLAGVNGAYYANGVYVMSQANFVNILRLKDGNGTPIMALPLELGLSPMLFGKGVTIDDSAGDNIYFGDFKTVVLAQNQNTSTLVDIYSLSSDLATKYVTSARMGAGALSGKSIAGLKPMV